MIDSVSSSTLGAAVGLQQASTQMSTAVKALKTNADAEQATMAALVSGASDGGNVTATRGQNVNLVV
jgi:hypothetical protein